MIFYVPNLSMRVLTLDLEPYIRNLTNLLQAVLWREFYRLF